MTAKEYLQQYQNYEKRIEEKAERLSRLRSRITKTTTIPTPDKVQSSTDDPIGNGIGEIEKLENEINVLIDQKVNLGQDIIMIISRLDKQQRDVLQMKYIDGCSFEIIAVHMNIDYRWATELHSRGLRKIETIFNKGT
jgi:DNA-directed RNA polymerase specialized sigma24 family protein